LIINPQVTYHNFAPFYFPGIPGGVDSIIWRRLHSNFYQSNIYPNYSVNIPDTGLYTLKIVYGNCIFSDTIGVTKNVASSSFSESICNGESYFFNNQTLTVSGAYKDTFTTSNGCDSIVTLTLTVDNSFASSFSHSICSGSSYFFNGQNLSTSG